jgi:uncharacterized membrane protein
VPRTRTRAAGERGGVLVFTAIIMVALLGATGLSVDIGNLMLSKTTLQAVADAAAMDARFALGSSNPCAQATALARQSATNNGFSYAAPNTMVVTLGTASPVANVETFVPDPTCADPSADTALSVQVSSPVKYAFSPGSGTPSATGYWTSTAFAGVSVGSSLVSLSSQQSLLGPLLDGLFGVDLTAAGYQGLATSNVTMGQLLAAAPTAGIAGLQVGTVSQLLNAQLGYSNLLQLTATALSMNTTDPTAAANATFLDSLASAVGALNLAGTVSLGQLIKLVVPGAASAADASLDVLGLVTADAELANGDHAAAVSLAGTGVSLPLPTGATMVGVSVQASAVSPPVVAYGPPGTAAQTSQVVILVDEEVTLPVTLVGLGLLYVTLDVPLYLTAAAATATIANPIACGPPSSVPIAVSSTTLGGYLADMTSNAQGNPAPTSVTVVTATLLRSAPVLYASGQLSLTLASAGPQTLTFTNPPDPPPTQNTSGSAITPNVDLGQLSVSGSGAFLLSASTLMGLLDPVLNPVVDQIVGGLTTSVVQPLLDDLGAQAGIATVGNPPFPGTTGVLCSGNLF